MNRPVRKQHSPKPGITIAELLITIALAGVIAAMTVSMLNRPNTTAWGRVAGDYCVHLSSLYNQIQLKTGSPPVLPTASIPDTLPTWESAAKYTSASPANMAYPSGLVVYLYPSQVLGGTYSEEWLLLDMNGSAGPNSLTSSGDRVLLYVENTTGQVLTGWQQDSGTYVRSFYDTYKGY